MAPVSLQTYDTIAEQYRDSKLLAFRHFIERYTLMELLGDLHDQTVLDMACGEGVYARQFRQAGAAEVTGVDISSAMVSLAEAQERAKPIGCRYVCADATEFKPATPVDVVTAIYLLNYARTPDELQGFIRACFGALRPGGLLVGFNDNIRRPPRPDDVSLAKYGMERTCARHPPREGDAIRYRMTNHDDRTFEFENYVRQANWQKGRGCKSLGRKTKAKSRSPRAVRRCPGGQRRSVGSGACGQCDGASKTILSGVPRRCNSPKATRAVPPWRGTGRPCGVREHRHVRTPFAGTWEASAPSCGVARRSAPGRPVRPKPEMNGRRSQTEA